MGFEPIQVLYLDDNSFDREFVRSVLAGEVNDFHLTETSSFPEFEQALAEDTYDLVLAALNPPEFDLPRLLNLVQARDLTLPVVLLTREGSIEKAMAALQQGAVDYLVKTPVHLQRLPAALWAALYRKRRQEARHQAEAPLHLQMTILQNIRDSIIVTDLAGQVRYWNEGATAIFGYTAAEMLGRSVTRLYPELDPARLAADLERVRAGQAYEGEWQGRHKDGSLIWIDIKTTLMRAADGAPIGFIGVSKEITGRKQAEEKLAHYAEQLQGLAQISTTINASLSVSEILVAVTDQARAIIGAHQATVSLTEGENWSQAIQHTSLTDKYAAWQDYKEQPDGSGIYALVCQTNHPIRLTQAELEAHPAWHNFGPAAGRHPPLRGWLAAPLVKQDGQNIGLIQLSDKLEGEFSADDEAILVQLAQMASVAVENAHLLAAERADQAQLRDLAHYLQAAREDERTRIAREIHDELGQALTALKIDLTWLAKRLPPDVPALRDKAGIMDHLLNTTLQTVRHLATELRPGLLDDVGLVAALEWQARDFSQRTGIECTLHLDQPDSPLGKERNTAIFRIFQETLTNIARHAAATRVEVEFKARPGELLLTIRDNGRGITRQQTLASTSLGLMGMRERARTWGGKISFTGRPGQGTTVTLRLPEEAGG